MGLKGAIAVAVFAVLLYVGLYIVPRVEYKVYTSGAIVVTGASSGIGHDAAVALAKRGYTVFGTVRKAKDAAALNALKIKTLKPLLMDVTNLTQIAEGAKQVKASKLPLVALVNNAGVSTRAPLEATPMSKVRSVYEVNVFGLHQATQAFLPLLRESQGRIVNVGSVAGLVAADCMSVYSGTKFAVEGITDALRRELASFGISVSLIEPAYVNTKIAEKSTGAQAAKHYALPGMDKVYAKFLDETDERRIRAFENADTTEVTDVAIIDAITAKYPKTRYVVANVHGTPANVAMFVTWLLPDRVNDLLVGNQDQTLKVFTTFFRSIGF